LTEDKSWSEVPPNHIVLIDQEIKLRIVPVGE
jgi:hypothetical protein